MREIFEFAEFLCSGWKLAYPNRPIDASEGKLDLALHDWSGRLPPRFAETLSFGNTRMGFRCYELPDILHAAQANLLAHFDGTGFRTLSVDIDDATARLLLRRRNIDPEVARSFAVGLSLSINAETAGYW